MSFFGDLVSSIETGQAPPRPPQVQRAPVPPTTSQTKPTVKTLPNGPSISQPTNALKRKADDVEGQPATKVTRPNPVPGSSTKVNSRPPTPVSNGTKAGGLKATSSVLNSVATTTTKAPPKGSYADIIARAKQAQEQRTQSKVGLIKHQATNKEKVSKLAERRRGEQEKAKAVSEKGPHKPVSMDRAKVRRSASPPKSEKAKTPKAPRPPLHAPAGYKGTMGIAPKKARGPGGSDKKSRYDEYLGTDEEEDEEIEDYDDGYGYDSEASSDMEAGIDDVEREEAMALRTAKEEDARELAEENRLKREKEERRRRLASMAAKGRR